jgi:hypothetical protein
MKKLLLIGLAVILFTACQTGDGTSFSRTSAEIDVVKTLINDYHEGNWESWANHYADTAKIYHNTWKEDGGISAQELSEGFKETLANFSSYGFEEDAENDLPWVEQVVNDNGNTWVYFWGNWKGTLAANNKELEVPVALAFRFADGKIVREEGFYNMAEIAAAMAEIEKAKEAESTEEGESEEDSE